MPVETRNATPPAASFGPGATGSRSPENAIFRKEGEYWTIGYGGKSLRLKDSKGLGYLAHLLRHPSVEFHVLDLAGGIAGERDDDETSLSPRGLPRGAEDLEKGGIHVTNLGDAGEMLDEQAKAAYRRRLSELREELEEAKQLGNVEHAVQAEQEIDALSGELSRAVGLGGRDRRAGSASERARQSIKKSIRLVLERVAQSDARLGDILSRCVRTGIFCRYQPDPDFPIAWEFAATTMPPARPTPSAEPAPARIDHRQTAPAVLDVSPFSLAGRTLFVGRESEGSAIRAAIDRGLTGHGSIVMLWDGPGVGKTRLAMEMAQYASGVGFRCSLGRCYERDEPFPYLPFAEIIEGNLARAASLDDYRRRIGDNAAELAQIAPQLRRIFPDLPQPLELPPAQQRHYLFQSVSEALARAARVRPQLLVLEDLHWADESTLALLIHLANHVAQLPVVMIGTYRSGYSDDNPALVRTLEELIRMGVRPRKLSGLSKDAVAQMLQGLSQREVPARLVSLIFEESQGYPFFVEEVYRHLVEEGKVFDTVGQFHKDIKIEEIDVPDNVRLIISRRLERLDQNEKRALAAAAVIGRSFSFQLLNAVSQIGVDELFTVIERAQRMGIIVPSSEGPQRPFTFRHELVRQTLLAGISVPRHEQLHSSVADAIERLNPDAAKERAGEIADHLLKAGSFVDRQKLVRWLTLAGKRALDAVAFEEALTNFEAALSRVDESDLQRRAQLLSRIGVAHRSLGRWGDAHRCLEGALKIFTSLDDREGIGKTCVKLAMSAYWAGGWREAMEIAERGLARLSGVNKERATLFAFLGVARTVEGEFHAADRAFNRALGMAEELSHGGLEGSILAFRTQFQWSFLRLREALEDSRRSAELTPPNGLWVRAERLLWYQASLYHLGRVQEAAKVGKELEPLAARVGHLAVLSSYRELAALEKFWKDADLTQFEVDLRKDIDANRAAGLDLFAVSSLEPLSLAEFFHGKWDEALQHAEAAFWPEVPGSQAVTRGTVFRLKAYAGDREGALALIDQSREMFPRMGQPNTYGSWALLLLTIEGLFVLGEREQAATLYPLMRELISTDTVCMTLISRFPQTAAGIAAAAAQNSYAAEDHFRIAMEQAESYPNQLEQAEIRRFHAMMLIDRAAPGIAKEHEHYSKKPWRATRKSECRATSR